MCHYLQYIFSSKDRTWRNLCANGKAKNQNQTNVIFELSGCTALKTGVSDCIIEITGRPLNGSSSCSPVWPLSHLEGHCQCWKTSTGFRATYAPIQERACIFQQGKLDSVSHRLFLMLYFLRTADSYVKYTKTVVNEPWQATACGNPVKPRNNRRVQFFLCGKAAIVSPHSTLTLTTHCSVPLLPKTARKPYSMCESGPWLYPSPLCPALLVMTMIATVLWLKYIVNIAYIATWSMCTQCSWPQRSFYSSEAILNSWII